MSSKNSTNFDYPVIFVTFLLVAVGILAIFSAGAPYGFVDNESPYKWGINQLKWAALGSICLFIASRINYRIYRKLDRPIIFLILFLLVLVFVPKVGREIRGVHRWIMMGPIQIQPSELAKLGVIIYVSCSLIRKKDKIDNFIGGFLPYFIIISFICLLVTIEPDLGSAIIIAGCGFILLYAGRAKISHMLYVASLSAMPLYYSVFEVGYRKERILSFLNPEADPLGSGFQPLHLMMSLGSGGLWGLGPGQGKEKLFYLPTPHTDSIFAVIGEEFGFIGTTSVIVLFVLLVLRGWKIAKRAPDDLGRLLAVGISTFIGGQALVNMGVATVILPTTGSALPFISYGGSSLLVSMTAIGILLSIARQSNTKR